MDLMVLLVPLGLAAAAGAAYAAWRREVRHREALAALAAERGWSLVARDDDAFTGLEGTPFGEGDNRRARHVLRGTHGGRAMLAFDYSYDTSSTDADGNHTTDTHRYAVCLLQLPCGVPRLQLTEEDVLTRIGRAFGLRDLELESEEFNRRYRVDARDPRFAYDVLQPRTMEALLARPTRNVRLSGGTALTWCSGRQTPGRLLAQLDHVTVLLDGVPQWVWTDRTRPGAAP